ncbi:hypothetical protein Emag_001505 [Eimeria magna]
MERQKMRGHESLFKLQRADSGVAPYHEVDVDLSDPHPKRRRSSTASSRSDSLSLHPEDSQRNHLCATRVESRADSICSTQQPTTPTGQAGTPNRTCTSPSNHSDSGATEAAATTAPAEATVAAAAATVAAAARVPNEEEKEAPSPSPLASPTPSLPSDAESCCLRPLLPPRLPVSHPCDSSVCAHPPPGLPRASSPQKEEGPCYCDAEGFLPGQGGALLGARYADIHTEREYLGLPKRPIKIMTYTNSGGYTETMCVDEEEKAASAPTEDALAAAASPPPSPAPSAAAEPPTATTSGAHLAATGAGSGGGYQRILWADEVIDASYRRKVWYRTDLHTFFSWLRSPSRHRPVKQRTYNARSLGYSEAKRLAFQFHPEECGDADFKKVYYLWKLKMKGKKKEEEAAAAALGSKDEAAAAATTAGSTGEGSADAVDALSAGGAEASAPVQQPAQLKRGWGPKRRNTRQRGLIHEGAGEQQQQQVPPVSAVARDVLSGNAGFCFSLSTPRQLRHLRDFGTISCAGLEDALFPSRNDTSPNACLDAGGVLHAAAEKAEHQKSLQVVGAAAWDFGAAGCITFAAPYEGDFEQQDGAHAAHGTFNAASDQLQNQQQQQQRQQQQQQKYSQEKERPRRAEPCEETLPSTNQHSQLQRRPQQRQSQAALRRRFAEEEQRRLLIAQQQAERQQREKELQQQQQELEQRQREKQQQDCQQQCYRHRHEELHLQQQLQEQQRQLWQRQKTEAQRQLAQRYREEGMQHSLRGGTHQQQQARPHQRQGRQQQQQQQQQQRQQVAGGAQSRDTQQQPPFDGLPQQREDSHEVERQQQLLQQQQQFERKQEEAAAAALAQRHQEIASLLQHLNPLARQRLEALLRSGALGKLSGPRAA